MKIYSAYITTNEGARRRITFQANSLEQAKTVASKEGKVTRVQEMYPKWTSGAGAE